MPQNTQEEFQLGPGAIASLLVTHGDALRKLARAIDGDFDPHGFEGADAQGELRRIANDLEQLAQDVRRTPTPQEKTP